MLIDRMKMVRFVDQRIAETADPKHRAQLEVLRRHMHAEVTEDVEALVGTITTKDVQYRVYGRDESLQPNSREGVRAFYHERKRQGELYFELEIERLTVADDIIITDGWTKAIYTGRGLIEAGITAGIDESAVYLISGRNLISWPFDDTGLLIGEEVFNAGHSVVELPRDEVPADFLADYVA